MHVIPLSASTTFETVTTTATDTVTSAQITIIITIANISCIMTVTPPRVTVSSTSTRTFSETIKSYVRKSRDFISIFRKSRVAN